MIRLRESVGLVRTVEGPRSTAGDARAQFAIFAFLLALAILFHQTRLGDWEVLSPQLVVSLAAIFVLLRPSSPRRFFAMLAIQLVSLLIDMPYAVNHWLLLGLTTVGLTAGFVLAAVRGRDWLSDSGEIYRRVAPVVRIQVVLVYVFAVFAKLNTDFLDTTLSCGTAMSADLLAGGPISLYGGWQDVPAIAGTLLIEALLPIGLLVRRTRVAAVLAGSIFHTVLAVAGHVPFSGFALAFYALFLPDDLPRRLRGVRDATPALRTAAARASSFAASPLAFPLLGGAWTMAAIAITYGPEDFVFGVVSRLAVVAFVAYALALAAVLFLCLRRDGPSVYAPGALRLAHPVWAIAPLLVVLNAASPYLGLKTQSSFTMYSNLQTEEGRWNHLLVPESVRIFDLQDDTVEVIRSSDERLSEAAGDGTELIEHDFLTYVSGRPELSVTYRQDGELITIPRGGDPDAFDRPGPIARKLLLFRDVPLAERNVCRDGREGGAAQGS